MKREFPRLPVIRNLGGCGSTMLAWVIAALPEVVLLSETNPRSAVLYSLYINSVVQVTEWLPELASSISTFDEHHLEFHFKVWSATGLSDPAAFRTPGFMNTTSRP